MFWIKSILQHYETIKWQFTLDIDDKHTNQFQQLLSEIEDEITGLKTDISNLEKENNRLRKELKVTKDKQADVFSGLEETERMAMKHQIKGLISKIDEHLDDKAWNQSK